MPPLTPNQDYCSIARALELLGERWTLHIVRDLLTGPKRFSELKNLVVGVTPKWLTARLRALESGGVVEREDRHYRLTPRGEALRPVLEELSLWSTEFDARPPHPDEAVIPVHDMWALQVYLNRRGPTMIHPVVWAIDLAHDRTHTLEFDGTRWQWTPNAPTTEPDVVLSTTARLWSTLLFNAQSGLPTPAPGYNLTGQPQHCAEFRALFTIEAPA